MKENKRMAINELLARTAIHQLELSRLATMLEIHGAKRLSKRFYKISEEIGKIQAMHTTESTAIHG